MSIVKITPGGESIICKAGEKGRFQFSISNTAGQDVSLKFEVKGSDQALDWLSIDGGDERTLSVSATSTVEVIAAPPVTLLKLEEGNKRFNFKLRANDINNSGDTEDSATVSVEVVPVPPPPKKFPWWIVILLLVLIGLGVGLYYAFK